MFLARTHEGITPAAILDTTHVPSMHHFGRMVQVKVATFHIWTCQYIEQELKMPIGYSAVFQSLFSGVVWEGRK